jgi:hypothetical protein
MSEFDDMSPSKVVAVGRKIAAGKFPVTPRIKQDLVNICYLFMEDTELKHATRMGAMTILLECSKLNLVMEKLEQDAGAAAEMLENTKGPKVVLLLPPNNSERPAAADVGDENEETS